MDNKSLHSTILILIITSLQTSIFCFNNSIQIENSLNSTQTSLPDNTTLPFQLGTKNLKSNESNKSFSAERNLKKWVSKKILLSSDIEIVGNADNRESKNKSIWLMLAGSSFLVVGVIGGFMTGNYLKNLIL